MFVLRVHQLFKTYLTRRFIPKPVRAVEDLSFEVEGGEIFGLLGPNGAGKTTTIKCILNLVHPDSGTIELLGRPVSSVEARARIGFLSESPYIYEFLTGRDYLTFSGKLYGMSATRARQKADELIALFHLEDAAGRQLRKYSKGMLQKIGLAQALLNDPDFLILDEPMSGLDPVSRKEVRDLMLALKGKGCTILFSSHILTDAELLCDRVGILVNGRLQTTGKLQSLIKKIRGYEVTISNVKQVVLDGIPHQVLARSDNQLLLQIPSVEVIESLLALSKSEDFQIEAIVPQRDTLEEIYLKQIKTS